MQPGERVLRGQQEEACRDGKVREVCFAQDNNVDGSAMMRSQLGMETDMELERIDTLLFSQAERDSVPSCSGQVNTVAGSHCHRCAADEVTRL